MVLAFWIGSYLFYVNDRKTPIYANMQASTLMLTEKQVQKVIDVYVEW